MSTKRARPPKRDESMTLLTISLPKALKEQIAEAAQKDRRSISNYLVTEIEKMLTKE